jgi:gamma-glutamylcyclotransferase (GGCT)/AIG2-like uncharacterized protein YtfP
MSAQALPLFAYGMLVERETLDRLLGPRPERTLGTAELADFEKVWIPGFGYHSVVPRPGKHVIGTLVEGLRDEDYVRLDEFEGLAQGHYRRATVSVRRYGPDPGEPVQAYVYVLGPRWDVRVV